MALSMLRLLVAWWFGIQTWIRGQAIFQLVNALLMGRLEGGVVPWLEPVGWSSGASSPFYVSGLGLEFQTWIRGHVIFQLVNALLMGRLEGGVVPWLGSVGWSSGAASPFYVSVGECASDGEVGRGSGAMVGLVGWSLGASLSFGCCSTKLGCNSGAKGNPTFIFIFFIGCIMEEFDSPRIFRSLVPSPLRSTPSPSKQPLELLYSSPIPRFILDAVENAPISDDIIELPKHYLPDFRFRLVNGHPNPSPEQFVEVSSYFPGCSSVSYRPPFLVVLWTHIPRKPWPLTFGGLPLFYGSPEHPRPPSSFGRAGGSQPIFTGAEDLLVPWVHPKGKIKEIVQFLHAQGSKLCYFGWTGVRWYAEVLSTTDGVKLPSKICGLLVQWKVWKNGISESARRAIIPNGGTITDTISYSPTLRPGVLVESAGGRGSSSGIPLLGVDGSRCITVAAHSFLDGDWDVYHPTYDHGNLVARVQATISGFDIALAKLEEGITYSSTSFDGDELNGTKLDGLIHSRDLDILTSLFLDSPYNGKCEGLLTAIGFHVFPIGSSNDEFPYLECDMIYFGNGANDIFPGTCGSAIWTDDKKVAAFFRWYSTQDCIALAPAVDALIEAGYDIDPIL